VSAVAFLDPPKPCAKEVAKKEAFGGGWAEDGQFQFYTTSALKKCIARTGERSIVSKMIFIHNIEYI
jgi:hypothetical protein